MACFTIDNFNQGTCSRNKQFLTGTSTHWKEEKEGKISVHRGERGTNIAKGRKITGFRRSLNLHLSVRHLYRPINQTQ